MSQPQVCTLHPTSCTHPLHFHQLISSSQADEEIEVSRQLLSQLQSVATDHPTSIHAISGANPLKRHHDGDSTVASDFARDLKGPYYEDAENNTQHKKRIRGVGWPLQIVEPNDGHHPSSRRSHSRRRKYFGLSPGRPSRFTEGSMGDRTSKKPPSLYITDESTNYQMGHANARRSGESDITFNAGTESSKSSGMHRFGKAIASAFNPVSVWHGINGIWKDKDVQALAEKAIVEERRVKAETAYAELKNNGYKGTKRAPDAQITVQTPVIKYEDASEPSRDPFRDSGVDLDESRTSGEQHDGYVSFNEQALLPPPQFPGKSRSTSPFSDANTSSKSSLHLRKPSLQGLKKAASHVHLPLSKRSSFQGASSQVDLPISVGSTELGLRSEPSRKELARQFKLSKRVSDLESKLDVARRELTLLEHDTSRVPEVPSKLGIKPFKPGTLATLPSESLLHQSKSGANANKEYDGDRSQNTGEPATGSFSKEEKPLTAGTLAFLNREPIITDEMDKAVAPELKFDRTHRAVSNMTVPSKVALEIEGVLRQKPPVKKPPPPVISHYEPPIKNLDHKVAKSEPKKMTSKKRKSGHGPCDEGTYRPSSNDNDDVEWISTKTTPQKDQNRPKKAAKTSLDGSPSMSKLVAKPANQQDTPTSAKKDTNAITPPSDKRKASNTAIIDKKKIIAMRSNPQSTAAFGTLSDDVINLRKMYPSITQQQLVDSMKPPKQSTKATNYTSVLHPNQQTTSFLAPPHSASIAKTNMKTAKHATSPASHSEQAKAGAMEIVPEDAVITISPGKDENVPPMPSLRKSFAERAKASKEMMEDQGVPAPSEDFQWDDDVF